MKKIAALLSVVALAGFLGLSLTGCDDIENEIRSGGAVEMSR